MILLHKKASSLVQPKKFKNFQGGLLALILIDTFIPSTTGPLFMALGLSLWDRNRLSLREKQHPIIQCIVPQLPIGFSIISRTSCLQLMDKK